MTRDEAVTQGLAAITDGTKAALGSAYDAGAGSVPAPTADIQAQIDAAVAAKAAADQSALDKVQAQLDAVTTQDATDKALAQSLQSIIDQVKAVLTPKA